MASISPAGGAELLCKYKPQLIDALHGDPDFLLQHCHASQLVTQKEYDRLKSCAVPWDKARDILDNMMRKDGKQVQRFLSLLKEEQIQEAFPKLGFLNKLPPPRRSKTIGKKRKKSAEEEDDAPRKQPHDVNKTSRTVTEKQLMIVARYIGSNWKEVGRVALDIPSVKLEQIIEDNQHSHKERVFSMLRVWSMREKDKASAVHLYNLLTQDGIGVAPGNISFLLDES